MELILQNEMLPKKRNLEKILNTFGFHMMNGFQVQVLV